MQQRAQEAIAPDRMAEAFEHSITWEDDIWRADPVDVEQVHAKARKKFADVIEAVTKDGTAQARILLFHGQSGAGKTHLIRALRTSAHRQQKAYFGYAQMTPDVSNYADYFLRRLIHSLEKSYNPDESSDSGLTRLTDRLLATCTSLAQTDLTALREKDLDSADLARLVLKLSDEIVASPEFNAEEPDVNIVRALLYLQRRDPRIDQRVRQYLYGRQLTPLAHEAVAALDPNEGEGRAFEIIAALGQLMKIVDDAALVFCIDQVEDLINFPDPEVRFQKAIGDLMQITNRVGSAIIIISCLDDFYDRVREPLAQSFRDRIEKSGPVALYESRSAEEARLIIAKRLEHQAETQGGGLSFPDASAFFGPSFFEEFAGLSTRRLLEHAQNRLSAQTNDGDSAEEVEERETTSFISTLAEALGFGSGPAERAPHPFSKIDYREIWERFQSQSEAEIPSDDGEMMDAMVAALQLAREEWGGAITLNVERVEVADDLPAIDLSLRHASGLESETRVFLCNRPTQGGGLKRQLDKVLGAMHAKTCFMLRASDFPPNKKNQTAQAFRKFRDAGGRSILVPIPEWERMIMVREFYAHHRADPGFTKWFENAKLLSNLIAVIQLLRLDLLGRPLPATTGGVKARTKPNLRAVTSNEPALIDGYESVTEPEALALAGGSEAPWGPAESLDAPPVPANDDDLPMSQILDENGFETGSIYSGRELTAQGRPITLNLNVMKRHSAVLGGSGSGKTTLALTLIEQLLLRGIPAVLIDRKGDLCSYANPDVWRSLVDECTERQSDREKLADAIDVAVYTPGRASGRPISITLLPNGISELPEHEQQLLANLSSAALGEMLHLKNSATHQKQSGTLSVALKILGSRSAKEVTLSDLISLLEEEDPELTDLTQRMDPSGKIRRDLVAQLDSLRHRNSSLFDGGGEPMSMESFLGLGAFARPNRTRLSIIYTGFLGDNENILFWVSQFLSEALRFCQRNPNDELQAVVMFDEADLYIPANAKPATAEPLQSLLKRARSAGLGLMLATQSPGDLDYKSRDQITSWFIGRVREDTALRKLKAAFQSESGLDPAAVLPGQTVGEFHLVQEGLVRPMKAQRSLITAEQVPFDRIEQLSRETKGLDEGQLRLFDVK
ncbi:Sigma 54 interacting domain-containing protein [Candidatus Filomicrobium marinum]|uniref:Sigma 54 interacting domain-containing protein n=1 Tax=Candidatus Filomicrobium marinum TaxID=1608628 RepID=A0A0D6JD27_9HYPH|nr:helicase HerA-like domain-containing protein [Candidatus Filomicrobium marinum]CFX13674.1 Sigma 54 interacting domain-containing protein [Candidatus Filomicrobium marinum]CPR17645.1 Sigma 54 interacting domain-containing protein [Candidatus Filomicrobium marinum]